MILMPDCLSIKNLSPPRQEHQKVPPSSRRDFMIFLLCVCVSNDNNEQIQASQRRQITPGSKINAWKVLAFKYSYVNMFSV